MKKVYFLAFFISTFFGCISEIGDISQAEKERLSIESAVKNEIDLALRLDCVMVHHIKGDTIFDYSDDDNKNIAKRVYGTAGFLLTFNKYRHPIYDNIFTLDSSICDTFELHGNVFVCYPDTFKIIKEYEYNNDF